jgi:hypothetical protein
MMKTYMSLVLRNYLDVSVKDDLNNKIIALDIHKRMLLYANPMCGPGYHIIALRDVLESRVTSRSVSTEDGKVRMETLACISLSLITKNNVLIELPIYDAKWDKAADMPLLSEKAMAWQKRVAAVLSMKNKPKVNLPEDRTLRRRNARKI